MNPKELLLHSINDPVDGVIIHVDPESAGWEYIGLTVHELEQGTLLSIEAGSTELGIVLLQGACKIEYEGRAFELGPRANLFEGKPWALYLPIESACEVFVDAPAQIAICRSRATVAHPPRLIRPEDIEIEIRGAGNAARQINHVIKPDFPADRLLIVEVITPSGNWSSYPPHKHDVSDMPRESDLEEIYYYRIEPNSGFGLQRLYTADGSLDEPFVIRDGDLLLVPYGYHAFAVAQGYTGYYLNVLAGNETVRTMQPADDPEHHWVRETWTDAMTAGIESWQDIDARVNDGAGRRH